MQRVARWLLVLVLCLAAVSPGDSRAQTDTAEPNPFPLLPGLEVPVEFWKKIFARYSVTQIVFFDPLDMSNIYEVMNVGADSRGKDYIASEIARIAAAHGVNPDRVKAQRGIKEKTAEGLKRSGQYIEYIQQVFREQGLPEDLAYLPLVESSFNIHARSHAGALGMWQFMHRTGKQYMRVNRHIDERKDPFISTRAAAAYLSQSYKSLKNWPLAITSYNFGTGGMRRAVEAVGSENLVDLIDNYVHPHWGFPPKNFYAEFLAAVEIGKNIEDYFPGLELENPAPFREIEVRKAVSVNGLARSAGITLDQFLDWNPAISTKARTIPAGYRVKLPADGRPQRNLEVAERITEKTVQVRHHRVKRGETIAQIARRYGASVERILQLNGIRRAHLLQVGALLLIPRS